MDETTLIHYGVINIVFIDCLINTVYRTGEITDIILFIDMFKSFCYLGLIIYSYKINWLLGILCGFICLLLGLYTTQKYYKIHQGIYTPI